MSIQFYFSLLFLFSFFKDYLVYGCSFENCYLVEQFRLSMTQRQPLFFLELNLPKSAINANSEEMPQC